MTTREYHNQYIGPWPRDIRYSFSDRVGQSAVQLARRDLPHPLPENLRDERSLCALAVEKAMQRYPELMRVDLEEFEKHGTVMEGVVKLPPQPPPPPPPPPPAAEPGAWVGEGGRKRKSRKRRSRKRKSRKRKSRKRKSRKRKSRK